MYYKHACMHTTTNLLACKVKRNEVASYRCSTGQEVQVAEVSESGI